MRNTGNRNIGHGKPYPYAWVGWVIAYVVGLGLLIGAGAFAAERTHPVTTMPLVPALPPERIQEMERWMQIRDWIQREIRRGQEYDDSTIEVVDYGTVKLVAGEMGVKLRRSYGPIGYLGFGFDRGQTYVESAVNVTHRIGIVPVDDDSMVVRAYSATGEIATNDTSTVGYLVWKNDR